MHPLLDGKVLYAPQKFDQQAARFLGLFLLHPVTGTVHQVHGSQEYIVVGVGEANRPAEFIALSLR